ncbi:MAG: dUTP diphosphatase [Candidatus Cloacimonetes bacterium]|nr:dUTP diphosphatase [Candidatus Cloacimonadota bacterium]
MIKVEIQKLNKSTKLPRRMTSHAAGYDIFSANESDIIINPGKLSLIPSGFAMSLPDGFEAQIRPRSGLALKHQIGVLNSPGTIDSDYRGEIKVILFNFGESDFVVKPFSRIAQMVIAKHEIMEIQETDILPESQRSENGFGSTKS